MMEIGLKIKSKDMENSIGQMGLYMKANSWMIKLKAKAKWFLRTEQIMKESGMVRKWMGCSKSHKETFTRVLLDIKMEI